jgi:hypothetical protein
MSNIIEVEITISQLVHDLRAGLTWFAAEDKGHGSIQAKYEMEDEDIMDIQAHPAFQQPIRRFKIVDDYSKSAAPVQQAAAPVQAVVETPVVSNTEEPVTEDAGALEFFSL